MGLANLKKKSEGDAHGSSAHGYRSRSTWDLMSNNEHLLPQRPFLININYHKMPVIIFLGGPTYCPTY